MLTKHFRVVRDCFFFVGLVILTGAFTLQIAGADPRISRQFSDGSIQSQIIMGTIYAGSMLFFGRTSLPLLTFLRAWPIFLFPLMAFASALWSPDPELTIRRSLALFGTTLFALALGSSYSLEGTLRIVLRATVLVMILSVLWAIIFPESGVHQSSDALEPIHAGRWRGVFSHKNVLGAVAGFTFGLLVLYARFAFKSLVLRIVALSATTMCLAFAGSGTGFVTALSLILIGLLMQLLAKAPFDLRLPLFLLFTAIVALFTFFAEGVVTFTLEALGRNPDLTGRTLYWSYILPYMSDHWLLGYGYFSGFLSIGATIATITHLDLGSTHNGYLDIVVSFGLIGLLISVFYIGWLVLRGTGLILKHSTIRREFTFPICVVFHALQLNIVESGFLAANSLWPLLLALVATNLIANNRAFRGSPQLTAPPRARTTSVLRLPE